MYSMVPSTVLALGTEHYHLAGELSSGNVCINEINDYSCKIYNIYY